MYKFGQIEIASKELNSVYQITNDVDCEKIRISEGVVANKHDTRYTIGYEVEPGKVVPLYIKTPKDFFRELPFTTRVLRGRWGLLTLVRMKPGCGNMKQFGGEYVAAEDLNLVGV